MAALEFVWLPHGDVPVPRPALDLCWRLEDRGVRFRVDESGELWAGPADLLDAEDRAEVRRWTRHIIALINYCAAPIDRASHLREQAAAPPSDPTHRGAA